MATVVAAGVRDCQQAWDGNKFRKPAGSSTVESSAMATFPASVAVIPRPFHMSMPPPLQPRTVSSSREEDVVGEEDVENDHNDDEEDHDIDITPLLDQLRGARGKGQHTCPFGLACDKGGVNEDGNLVVIEMNSTFRSVNLPFHFF